MNIVFFGTPDYVLPVLNTLHKEFKSQEKESPIVAVVTQKPKPVGRKQLLTYSPVDDWAHKKSLTKFYSCQEFLNSNIIADIGILAAYGEIIPNSVIDRFRFGILNIHPSLLPKYRGASPVQAALVAGDSATGVSIIKLDEQLDHGPIISQFEEEILSDDTTETLRRRLFARASEVLVALIKPYMSGKITPREQNHAKATFTRQLKKADGFISAKYLDLSFQGKTSKSKWKIPFVKDFSLVPSANSLYNFIRAMQPWPIAWTNVRLNQEKRLKLLNSHLDEQKLILDEVQLEGKNPVSYSQFRQAYPESIFAD
jgi:methionyl-tRNA formyltransferase